MSLFHDKTELKYLTRNLSGTKGRFDIVGFVDWFPGVRDWSIIDVEKAMRQWLEYTQEPHFYVTEEAVSHALTEAGEQRAKDMVMTLSRAGVMRLPLPKMLVEFPSYLSDGQQLRMFVALREHLDNQGPMFSARIVALESRINTILVPVNAILKMDMHKKEWETSGACPTWLQYCPDIIRKDSLTAYLNLMELALNMTVLAFYDRSMQRTVREATGEPPKVVRSTAKPISRRHVVIDITPGYKYENERIPVKTGRHQPLHLRAGSWRTYWTGKRRNMASLRFVDSYEAGDPAYGVIDHSYIKQGKCHKSH